MSQCVVKRLGMTSGQKLSSIMDKVVMINKHLIQLVKADIPFVSQLAIPDLSQSWYERCRD